MTPQPPGANEKVHRFLDEAGDTTFLGKGGIPVLGLEGVSLAFGLGMVSFHAPIAELRKQVVELQRLVETDDYLKSLPSVQKRIQKGGFFFHAKDDAPEVRERLLRWIRQADCSLEMVVGRKLPSLFARKHNGRDSEFYADLLSHLLNNKLHVGERLVLNVAERGTTTRNTTLELALTKARERFAKKRDISEIRLEVVFNVQNPRTEPLLCVADYFCWTVQRVFERGETRHYDFIRDRISQVVDLYDDGKTDGDMNCYTPQNPLTAKNKLSPPAS